MSKHYLIFIHGIGELKANDRTALGYEKLWQQLIKQSGLTAAEFNERFGRIEVIWHVDQLQSAEATLSKTAFPDLNSSSWNPIDRIRSFMNFFIGDVAAYVSEDVNFIRRTVWNQIWNYCDPETNQTFPQLLESGATYSIIAHSLGTVIAFDYLFDLFNPESPKLFVPAPNVEKRPEDRQLTVQDHVSSAMATETLQLLQKRFRHFFSMGSPIGLFLMRKGALWAEGEPFAEAYNPVRREGRAWCNFWDSDDPIAYPLAKLFGKNIQNAECKLLDIAVETGWILSAHVDYWKNRTVAKEILRWIEE